MNSSGAARLRFCILLALMLVSLLGAWSFEFVDDPMDWAWVEVEVMPTGTVCVCYQDSITYHVYVARKQAGVWQRDDLGRWIDTAWAGSVGRHLVQGPNQEPAVLLEADTQVVYAVRAETGWSYTTVPCTTGYAFLAFDSTGNPALAWWYGAGGGSLASAYCRDGTWRRDVIFDGGYPWTSSVDGLWDLVLGPDDRFELMWSMSLSGTGGNDWLFVSTGVTDTWTTQTIAGGFGWPRPFAWGLALAPGRPYAACFDQEPVSGDPSFYCDTERIDYLADNTKVRVDAFGRRLIVYRSGFLKFAIGDHGAWLIDTLPVRIADTLCDLAVDTNSLPLIAFRSTDGVFLATGNMVGVTEKPPQVLREPLRLPTIVRGAIQVDSRQNTAYRGGAELLDISGRKIAQLHAGANDVSRLAPGVYFVRRASDSRADKVVIER